MWGSLQLLIVLHGVLNKPAPARVSLVHTICDQNGVWDFGNSVPRRLWLVVTGVEWHTHITVDVNYKKVAELHLVYRTDPPSEPEPVKKLRQGRQDLEVPPPNILFQRKCAEEREIDPKLSKSPNPALGDDFMQLLFQMLIYPDLVVNNGEIR